MNTAAAVVNKLREEGNDMATLLVMAMDSCMEIVNESARTRRMQTRSANGPRKTWSTT